MATKVEAAGGRLYEDDFYAWTRQQAALLRAGRFAALDLDHLTLAILESGDMQREAVLSNARVVIEHLAEARPQPLPDPRNGWRATVREHRARLESASRLISPPSRPKRAAPRLHDRPPQRRGRAARPRRAAAADALPTPARTPPTSSPPTGGRDPPATAPEAETSNKEGWLPALLS